MGASRGVVAGSSIVNGGSGDGRGRNGVRVSLAKRCEEAVKEANRVDEVFRRAKVPCVVCLCL